MPVCGNERAKLCASRSSAHGYSAGSGRAAHVSGPTRVRRFLSRFLVVLVVALTIEGLVATFRALHENPSQLPAAASILVGTALLLAGWGLFIRLNVSAENLEPEAMAEAKREDKKLKL
jgi:hypothetical protein